MPKVASPSVAELSRAPRKRSVWPALLPAMLVMGLSGAMVYKQRTGFTAVEEKMGLPPKEVKAAEASRSCVETYGLTLHTSEFYVRQAVPGVAVIRKKGTPRELSTVVRGMARNTCGKALRGIKVRVNVLNERGKPGSAWAKIGTMGVGQAKPFELAWMGRVTLHEVESARAGAAAPKP